MILAYAASDERYAALHPGFPAAFEFLRRKDLAGLDAGKYPIEGDKLFALVQQKDGLGQEKARLEIHKRFIDIQYTISGAEVIGWMPAAQCTRYDQEYNSEKDIAFFTQVPEVWIATPPGMCAIFFPEDGHAPLGGSGPIHKIVVKVAAGW